VDVETLKSYLVSLGFAIDKPQLRQFEGALKAVAGKMEGFTAGVVVDVLKWQAVLTGAFVGVSTAVIGMADHVAMADQKYRLMGLSMFMTKESARKLSIGMEALGASMQEIAWDPELNKRFLQLSEDQDTMAKSMGSDFDANMRSIRDLRFEFTRLHVAMEYLGMEFVNKLFEKFGMTLGDVHEKIEKFITWFQEHIPAIADELATDFVPILKDTWNIVLQLGEVLAGLGTIFTNLVGLFSGDKSIEGTEFSFHKLAGAVEHVVKWISTMLLTLTQAEQMLVHFANAVSLLMNKDFRGAKDELLAGLHVGLQALGPNSGMMFGAGIGTLIGGPGFGTAIGAAAGGAIGQRRHSTCRARPADRLGTCSPLQPRVEISIRDSYRRLRIRKADPVNSTPTAVSSGVPRARKASCSSCRALPDSMASMRPTPLATSRAG
jgi:hypothetical protein